MALVKVPVPVCSISRPLVRVVAPAIELKILWAETPAVSWFSMLNEVGVTSSAKVKIMLPVASVRIVLPEAAS